MLYIRVGPTCRGLNACVRVPLGYKRETPVRLSKAREVPAEASTQLGQMIDSFICKSNTTHSGCRVLRSSGPNYSKSSSVLVFFSLGRPAESLSASPSTHPLGLGGCTTPPGCGSPQTTTFGIVRGDTRRRRPDLRSSLGF